MSSGKKKIDDGFAGESLFRIQGTSTLADAPPDTSQTKVEAPTRRRYCGHHTWVVDEETRTVTCGDKGCGVVLEPFDLLLEYAKKERRFADWQAKQREVAARVSDLEEQERKIKARTRAAARKDADEAVNQERRKIAERGRMLRGYANELEALASKIARACPEGADPKHVYSDTCTCWNCRWSSERRAEKDRLAEYRSRLAKSKA